LITLILGGNKSGKSDLGLTMLARSRQPGRIVVTGKALDAGFREQINRHRQSRPKGLEVVETDRCLRADLKRLSRAPGCILIDSLDFWLYQVPAEKRDEEIDALDDLLQGWSSPDLIFVSCELGLGPLPASGETRRFCRDLGELHLRLARKSEMVYMAVAGCPLCVKNGRDPGESGKQRIFSSPAGKIFSFPGAE